MSKKPLVAVIAFNEERNICSTLDDLEPYRSSYDVIVVDNCSSDDTAILCRKRGVTTLRHCVNSGNSFGTLQTYFRYARENNYSVLAQFDGDGQHIAAHLERILDPVSRGDADCVIGSRFIDKTGFQSYFFRRIGIKTFGLVDSFLIGTRLSDVTSGFRAYGPRVIDLLGYRMRTQIYDPNQLVLAIHYANLRIAEVPVTMRPRHHGTSEFRDVLALAYPLKGLVNVVGCVLQRRQIRRMARPWDSESR